MDKELKQILLNYDSDTTFDHDYVISNLKKIILNDVKLKNEQYLSKKCAWYYKDIIEFNNQY